MEAIRVFLSKQGAQAFFNPTSSILVETAGW